MTKNRENDININGDCKMEKIELPKAKKTKMVSKEKFIELANKVRKHIEKEEEILNRKNGNNNSGGIIIYS